MEGRDREKERLKASNCTYVRTQSIIVVCLLLSFRLEQGMTQMLSSSAAYNCALQSSLSSLSSVIDEFQSASNYYSDDDDSLTTMTDKVKFIQTQLEEAARTPVSEQTATHNKNTELISIFWLQLMLELSTYVCGILKSGSDLLTIIVYR